MNLGFKDQFVSYVLDGSKRHTIRGGERWKAGMRADLFRRSRQPKAFQVQCLINECSWDNVGPFSTEEMELQVLDDCPVCGSGVEAIQVGGMELLFRAPVVKVEPIQIWYRAYTPEVLYADEPVWLGPIGISINDDILTDSEANSFAWFDGFRRWNPNAPGLQCLKEMAGFWAKEHGIGGATFTGQLIHWDYDERFTDVADTCFHLTRSQAKGHLCA